MHATATRRRFGLTPARVGRVAAVVAAAALVSVSVIDRSSSAFSAATEQQTAKWTAGSMSLTAENAGNINLADMMGGDSVTRCVTVTYTGTVPAAKLSPVKLVGTAVGNLLPYLKFDVALVNSCNPKVGGTSLVSQASLTETTAPTWLTPGLDTGWTPSVSGQQRGFEMTVTLPTGTGNDGQGKTATVAFGWDLQAKPGTAR